MERAYRLLLLPLPDNPCGAKMIEVAEPHQRPHRYLVHQLLYGLCDSKANFPEHRLNLRSSGVANAAHTRSCLTYGNVAG